MAIRDSVRRGRERLGLFGLAGIVVVALALRLYGLNWDDGHLFHPDERMILMVAEKLALPQPLSLDALLRPDSPLSPQFFRYGSFPFYLLRAAASLLGWLGTLLSIEWLRQLATFEGMRLVGRALSALFDVGTLLVVYALGRRLYGQAVGLLAAGFVALAVLDVQLAHFYASDTLLTFFVVAALYCLVGVVRDQGRRWPVLAGIAVGLALATKASAAPVLAAVGAAYLLRAFGDAKGEPIAVRPGWTAALCRAIPDAALTVAVAAGTFAVCEPYALIDFRTFVQHISEESAMARGVADLPYTRQFANRPAYLYLLQNLTVFGLGIPLGLTALAGWLYVLVRAARSPRAGDLLLLSWVLPYFLITGDFYAKFLRYTLPIAPVLCLFGAVGLVQLGRRASASKRGWLGLAVAGLAGAVVLLTGLNALAYVRIYSQPHPAVAASRWIYEHVPPGAAIATEHWEEGMPVAVAVDGLLFTPGGQGYRLSTLNLYENDDEAKLNHIVQELTASDYVVFFSNRLYGTIPRLPERYPLTTEYYRLLFGEKLGYRLVAAFPSYPNVLGVTLADDTLSDPGLPTPALLAAQRPSPVVLNLGHADESFSVYDHPKVLIFQKTEPLSPAALRDALRPALASRAAPPATQGKYKSLLLTPAERAADAAGGTFRDLFNRDDLANRLPVPVWALMAELLGLAAAPLAFAVARGLADRGYLLAKTLGVLLLAWTSWMLVSLGLVPNGRLPVFGALALLLAAGAGAFVLQRGEMVRFARARRRLLLVGEGVFWGAFLLFLAIRMLNPDLWHPARGGEKPMDLAYLMAVVKSETFPPYDPWFAGGYLNYYYFGQVIVAALVKLSGIVPTTAYNLVVPHLFALTLGGAFTAAYNLIPSGERPGQERRPLVGGLVAAVFLGILGNLAGGLQLAGQIARAGGLVYRSTIPGLTEVAQLAYGIVVVALGRPLPIGTDWYWPSTRVIEGTINEFPFFTFLYADLHAHLIALPLTLLVLGLAVSAVKSGQSASGATGQRSGEIAATAVQPEADAEGGAANWAPGRTLLAPFPAREGGPTTASPSPVAKGAGALGLQLAPHGDANAGAGAPATPASAASVAALVGAAVRPALSLFVLALAVGSLMPANSWDYPTYLGVVALALLIPWYLSAERRLGALAGVALWIAAVGALSYALYLPFHLYFQSFYFGLKPISDKSPVSGYLAIHGLFLAALLTFVAHDFFLSYGRNGTLRFAGIVVRWWDRLPRLLGLRRRLVVEEDAAGAVGLIALITGLALAGLLAAMGMALVGLLGLALALVLALALRRGRPAEETFLLALFAVGLALGIVTELVAIDGDVGRMNTVFKFYLQVWVLWSVGAAVALARSWDWLMGERSRGLKQLWLWGLGALLLLASVYPVVGTWARVRDRFDPTIPPTLDGTAYMRTAVYQDEGQEIRLASDLAAIRWLQDNVAGSPVVLEAQTPLYRWGSRVSIYTGLPTVIGWDWHQKQQRWGYQEQVDERGQDVRALYSSPSVERTLDLLREYHVAYVYVGGLERAYYPAAGLAKFDKMVGQYLDLVYDRDGVKIYRVLGEGG